MLIKKAEFMTSAGGEAQLKRDGVPEIAFVGKSNVGKSSFVNYITGNGKLAKTSKEPGRTRLVNYFSINGDSLRFIDLPGYGFARVSEAEKQKWGQLIEAYLRGTSVKHIFVLVDIRRDPSEDDKLMLNYLYHYNIPFTVVLTKSDKLSRSAGKERLSVIANALCIGIGNIITASALAKEGKEKVLERIEAALEVKNFSDE